MATRPLEGVEALWATPKVGVSVQLAIKLPDEQLIPKLINNMKKIFYATKIKVIDGSFHQLQISDNEVPVKKLPNHIQRCQDACQWAFDNNKIDISKSLCTIAANDNMVVVNANHSVHDAGYSYKALQHCLDDKLPKMPALPTPTFTAYKPEFDAVKRSGILLHIPQVTSVPNDMTSKYLAPKDTKWKYDIFEMPMTEISCVDKKKGKPKGLTEFLFVGLGMTLGSLNNNVDTIGTTMVVDLRRVVCPERVDWSFGVTPSVPRFEIKTSPSMRIEEAMESLRLQINEMQKDNGFIRDFISPMPQLKSPNDIVRCLSSAGPMVFKPPVKDFYLKSTDYGVGNDAVFAPFSYSKIGNGKNTFVCSLRSAPAFITSKMESILCGSFKHWITKISPKSTIKDALEEMKSVQALIAKDF